MAVLTTVRDAVVACIVIAAIGVACIAADKPQPREKHTARVEWQVRR